MAEYAHVDTRPRDKASTWLVGRNSAGNHAVVGAARARLAAAGATHVAYLYSRAGQMLLVRPCGPDHPYARPVANWPSGQLPGLGPALRAAGRALARDKWLRAAWSDEQHGLTVFLD